MVPLELLRPGARLMATPPRAMPDRAAGLRVLEGAVGTARSGIARLAAVRPLYVVGAFIAVEWLVTLGLALTVRHNGWLYYQGGDQVWYYTTSWLLAHGQIPLTAVGYGWSVLLLPFTMVDGPNLLQALPAIVLLDTLVLMPVAMAAMYGIGARLGGRLFGYWVLLVWVVTPLVGVEFTNTGYHQKYTEITLPQAFGLTALSDFPSMVMLAVGTYFLLRSMQRFAWPDAVLAGAFVGFGIGIKPSNGLFLIGALLALAAARRWRTGAIFVAVLGVNALALTVWKWRGYGYLPLFHAEQAVRLALGKGGVPLAGVNFGRYIYLDWGHLQANLDSIQEHFWSLRVFEWIVIAGVLALARRSLTTMLLFGGWFLSYAVIKGSDPVGNIEDSSLLRMLIPTIPAFVVMLAALPLLVPAVARRLPVPEAPRPWPSLGLARTSVIAAAMLFVAIPTALAAAAHRIPASSSAIVNAEAGPIPTDSSLRLDATTSGSTVQLSWRPVHVAAGRIFYWVVRGSDCTGTTSLGLCGTTTTLIAADNTHLVDAPPAGSYLYVLEVSANWLNDPTGGDPHVASPPVPVTVP